MPSTIGVRASPADRSAPPSMKNTSIPLLHRNITRRNGSACTFTAGAAFTRSSSAGEAKYPIGAMMNSEIPIAVRNAWYTVRSTLSASPAPAKRATSTLIPMNNDEMKAMTTMKICHATPMAAFPAYPTRLPTRAWSTIPCRPPMRFVRIVGQAIFHTVARSGPSTIERS